MKGVQVEVWEDKKDGVLRVAEEIRSLRKTESELKWAYYLLSWVLLLRLF